MSPRLGAREVVGLTPTDVAEWIASLPEAPRQREQVADLLRAVLNLAIDRELIDRNPAARSRRKTKAKSARTARREVSRLTREEVVTIAARMPPERQLAVLVAAYTGVRFGELAALRRSDFELRRNDDRKLIGAALDRRTGRTAHADHALRREVRQGQARRGQSAAHEGVRVIYTRPEKPRTF